MRPSVIEPATFRAVAQHLNHCASAVPPWHIVIILSDKRRLPLLAPTRRHVSAAGQVGCINTKRSRQEVTNDVCHTQTRQST